MAKADRTPKKIAGLKLPKEIRQAPAVRSLLATAAGRKLLGDALIEGAATAAARVLEAHNAAKAAKPAPKSKKPAASKPSATLTALNPAPKSATSSPSFGAKPVSSSASAPVKAAPPIASAPAKPPVADPFKPSTPETAKPAVQVLNDLDDDENFARGKTGAAD